jgi:alkylated DNA repair dioxygenase AlkB
MNYAASQHPMSQQTLFPETLPEGFLYQPDFLRADEESDLLRTITHEPFEAMDYHGFKALRRTVEFGFEYDFGSHKATPTRAFPDYILPVRDRAAAFAGIDSADLVEGMVIEYPPGAPIGWHRDAPQFGTVIGISLGHEARMRFRPYKKEGKLLSVTLEPRSIYVLRASVRWQWQHSIPPVEELRYSITFRTLLSQEKVQEKRTA